MAEESTAVATETPVEGDPAPVTPDAPSVPEADPATPQHWSRNEALGFDSDTIGWLENKGFENPQETITSQRELEKKMGGPPEMLQKWPESDDKEGFKDIYRRLGTPEKAEDYNFEFEEGAPVDEGTLSWFKGAALGRNMPNDMAQGLILDWNTEVARVQAEQQQVLDVQNQTEETELRNQWGTKYDERLDYGHRALIALGLEEDHIDTLQGTLGPKMLAEFAAKIADTMGEDTIAQATQTTAFGTTKEQVHNRINKKTEEFMADKERYDKYLADHSAPKEATGKDYREMQILWAQLEGMIKAEVGG